MKKFLITLCVALTLTSVAMAGSYVPKEGEVQFKVLQSTKDKPLHEVLNTPFTHHYYALHKPIDLDAAKPSHDYLGIGVSLTDASCWLLSQLDPESRHKLLKMAFTKRGLNLSMIRLNCGSSDYATELYNYNDTKGDVEMKNFSIARDEQYMIPMIKLVSQYCPDVYTFSSVWSMPGWMKSNGQMCGGSLLDEYMPAFAAYWTAYLKAYKAHGIKIDAVTVQNEPSTDQRGGCPATLVSARQEIELAGKYMPQAFKAAGLDTKIWIWDHDYVGWERVVEVLADKRVQRNAAAVAWHPYSGKPEMMQEVLRRYPNTKMHLTERGPSFAMKAVQNQVWWAEYVFGALNNGCSSFSSWNLLLDEDGQPNTGRHPCAGLLSIDLETGKVTESTQALFFRQFSPYVKRGAKILSIEQPEEGMTAIAFQNPEGDYVVVVAAHDKPLKRQRVQIKFKEQYMALCLPMNTWSLTTVLIEK
ncbi:MAG: hypothetical protein IKA49_03605 [Alistipes sp.]|nr:hypothetical protein [Alistipes sp.]